MKTPPKEGFFIFIIVKDIIKKILREEMQISNDAPHWVKSFYEMSREERIEQIEKNKTYIEKRLTKINEFFKTKFGDSLVRIGITKDRGRHYGNEMYSTNVIVLKFYFSHTTPQVTSLKKQVINDLRSFFDIDISYYGTPLDLDFYKEVWEKF